MSEVEVEVKFTARLEEEDDIAKYEALKYGEAARIDAAVASCIENMVPDNEVVEVEGLTWTIESEV